MGDSYSCRFRAKRKVGLYLTALINQFINFILQVTKYICSYLEHTLITVIGAEILDFAFLTDTTVFKM